MQENHVLGAFHYFGTVDSAGLPKTTEALNSMRNMQENHVFWMFLNFDTGDSAGLTDKKSTIFRFLRFFVKIAIFQGTCKGFYPIRVVK